MTARTFDPEQNRKEILALYGPTPETDWEKIISSAVLTTSDEGTEHRYPGARDLRDPKKLGQRILRNVRRRSK